MIWSRVLSGSLRGTKSRAVVLFKFLACAAVLLQFMSPATAGSRLIFPRFSFDSGTITGIALVNPGKKDAAVTLTARDAEGRLITGPGFSSSRTWTVKPGRQLAQLLKELFVASLPADPRGGE